MANTIAGVLRKGRETIVVRPRNGEENQAAIDRVAARHPDFTLETGDHLKGPTARTVHTYSSVMVSRFRREGATHVSLETYLELARPVVLHLVYRAPPAPGRPLLGDVSFQDVVRLTKIATLIGFPVVVTSGSSPQDERPTHRAVGGNYDVGTLDFRIRGLTEPAIWLLTTALTANGWRVERYGEKDGFAPHLHAHGRTIHKMHRSGASRRQK